MSRPTNEQRLTRTLQEYATQAVPDNLDPWPAIRERISETIPAQAPEEPLPGRKSRAVQPAAKWRKSAALGGLVVSLATIAALVLLVAMASSNRTAAPVVEDAKGPFVPEGMVRHIVMTDTTVQRQPGAKKDPPPTSAHWDMWYVNGAKHLLMYSVYSWENILDNSIQVTTRTTWVEDGAVYEYMQEPASAASTPSNSAATVSKYPYSPYWLGSLQPDPQIISDLLRLPNSRIAGNAIIDGRPAVEIISVPPDKYDTQHVVSHSQAEHRYWVDTTAHRIVQRQLVTRQITGPQPGLEITDTIKVVLYELKKESAFPPDFFQFKPPDGVKVVEKDNPYASPSPTVLAVP
jgi:hypothetical protein